MNGVYIGIGAVFIAIGSASIARSRKAGEAITARNRRTSGILMMVAGVIFMATGVIAGRA